MCLLIKPDMETVNCSGAETRQQQSCPLSSDVVLSEPFLLWSLWSASVKGLLQRAMALTQSVCFEPVPRSSAILMWFWLWFEVWVFVAIDNNGLNRDIALAKSERQQDFVAYSVTQLHFDFLVSKPY